MLKLICSTMILLGSVGAFAGIHLEPYVAYETGASDVKQTNTLDASYKGTATQMGLRAGYSFLGFWSALDYQMTTGGKAKFANPLFTDGDYKRNQLYLTVGFDLPVLARVYAGYGLQNKMSISQSGQNDQDFSGGTATKVGVGFSVIPFLKLNIEVQQNTYKDLETGGTKSAVDQTYPTFKETFTAINLSFPIPLL